MEKEISAKDSRFKLGEEFKEDIQVKPDPCPFKLNLR